MHKKYKIKAIPLTNIHIGTGKELEPLDYFIENKKFVRFQPFKIISQLNEEDKNTLLKIINSNNLKEVALFLYKNITSKSIVYETEVSDILEKEFEDKFKSTQNQQIVMEIYRDKTDFMPIIPGSSIKGAIRTAVLYAIMKNDKKENFIKQKAEKIFKLQAEILNLRGRDKREKYKDLNREKSKIEPNILKYFNAKNDPFRAIHITDCKINLGEKFDTVVKIYNWHLNKEKSEEFLPSVEAIKGIITNGNGAGYFYINIFQELQNINKKIDMRRGFWQPPNKKINMELMIKACKSFYKKNFERDLNRLRNISNSAKYVKLKEEFNNLKENEFIIRLGRYSQKENVTIIQPNTITRMLDENYLPMGYLKFIVEEN